MTLGFRGSCAEFEGDRKVSDARNRIDTVVISSRRAKEAGGPSSRNDS